MVERIAALARRLDKTDKFSRPFFWPTKLSNLLGRMAVSTSCS
jgi:hypothetical protein